MGAEPSKLQAGVISPCLCILNQLQLASAISILLVVLATTALSMSICMQNCCLCMHSWHASMVKLSIVDPLCDKNTGLLSTALVVGRWEEEEVNRRMDRLMTVSAFLSE